MTCRVRGIKEEFTHHTPPKAELGGGAGGGGGWYCARCGIECEWTSYGFVPKPVDTGFEQLTGEGGKGATPSELDTSPAISMPSGEFVSSPDGLAWRKVECWHAKCGDARCWLSFTVRLLNDGLGPRARYHAFVVDCREDGWSPGTVDFGVCESWSEVQRRCRDFAAEWLKVNQSAAVEVDRGKAIGVDGGPDVGGDR